MQLLVQSSLSWMPNTVSFWNLNRGDASGSRPQVFAAEHPWPDEPHRARSTPPGSIADDGYACHKSRRGLLLGVQTAFQMDSPSSLVFET